MSQQNNRPPCDTGTAGKGGLREEKLRAYLEGRLSPEEQHDVEMWLAEEGMESDALEGLGTLPPGETIQSVNKLNNQLRKSLAGKKRKRRPPLSGQTAIIAIAIILLLALLAYIVIRKSV